MMIQTKFSPGDKVWKIGNVREKETVICPVCEGKGKVTTTTGHELACSAGCHGNGHVIKWKNREWRVIQPLTLSQVRAQVTGLLGQWNKHEEEYMAYETGTGTGTLHKLDTLFESLEAAQEECRRRNAEAQQETDNGG